MKDNPEHIVRDLSVQLNGRDEEALPDQAEMLAMCRTLREQRRRRSAHFPTELFHEPSWDMLLMLYVARVERRTMYVKTLVLAADAPITTSQRWIDHLARMDLAVRTEDPVDRRRIEVCLSDAGCRAMEAYLIAMRQSARV